MKDGVVGKVVKLAAAAALVVLGTTACNDTALTTAPVAGDPPTAVITGAQQYNPLDTAAFDGSQSTAVSPKTITAYDWSITARPSGSTAQVQIVGTGAQAEFFVDLAGDYKIKLKVTDSEGLTGETEYAFSAVPSQSLHVELTWTSEYTRADMDLHLVNKGAGGTFFDAVNDCDYTNCKPDFGGNLDWGQSGYTNDNPTLDIDNITDSVPENINIKSPADGTYEVDVHYYASHGATTVPCHVRIYLAGAIAWEGDMTLDAPSGGGHPVWTVADINWSSGQGTVTPVNTTFMATQGG